MSLKAMLVANAVQTAIASIIFCIASLAALGVTWGLTGFPADIDPIAYQLKSSSLFLSLMATVTVLPSSLIAGYTAGRIARNRPVLHGALSGVLWVILLFLIALGVTPSDRPHDDGPDIASTVIPLVMFFGPPLFGALGGFLRRQWAQNRESTAAEPSQHTNWWWLGYFGVQSWTVEERRARIELGMAGMVAAIATLAIAGHVFEWSGVEMHWAAFLGAVLGTPIGLFLARPIIGLIDADVLRRGDENAAQRLTAANPQRG